MSLIESEVNEVDLNTWGKSDGLPPLLKRSGCFSEIFVFWFNPRSEAFEVVLLIY